MYRSFLAGALAAALLGPSGTAAQQTPLARPPLAVSPEVNPTGAAPRSRLAAPSSRLARSALCRNRKSPAAARRRRCPRHSRRMPTLSPSVATWPRRSRSTPWRAASSASATRCGRVDDAWRAPSHRARRRSADPGGPLPAARTALQEWDIELGAPIWLPGQRSALAGTVTAGVAEQERRFALRRLEVAALLRDAYWSFAAAESELRVARDRLTTARGVGRDFDRRVAFGDIAATEALLGRNEELSALLELGRAEAAVAQLAATYGTLTGGSAEALSGGPVLLPEVAIADAASHPGAAGGRSHPGGGRGARPAGLGDAAR